MAQELMEDFALPVAKKAIQIALQGDIKAIQLCLERMVPVRRDLPVKIGKQPLHTAADVSRASDMITQKAIAGEITAAQGQLFAELLEARRKTIETEDLEKRLRAVEAHKNDSQLEL